MKILFIGNSHTYYNGVPQLVKELLEYTGVHTHVTMSTEGGKGLLYHCNREDVNFNIRYGGYDAVVLQDKASHFNADEFKEGGRTLVRNSLGDSPARRVLYMIWARRDEKELQEHITRSYVELGEEIHAAVAPAGEVWHKMLRESPELEDQLYHPDGNHAKPLGSYIAATTLFYAITDRKRPIAIKEGAEPSTRLGLDVETVRRIHKEACAMVRKFHKE
ncbi:MAG: SGNH/GDSL hydrolase family protein [Clostridia bacterium]|nr:SGNH/GDSL hydrolase family protein [Clostridia bacterium]